MSSTSVSAVPSLGVDVWSRGRTVLVDGGLEGPEEGYFHRSHDLLMLWLRRHCDLEGVCCCGSGDMVTWSVYVAVAQETL